MLSLSRARALLAAASTSDELAVIARELGFSGAARRLDAATRVALGFPAGMDCVAICRGPGAARALLIQTGPEETLRESITRAATRLAARSPQLLWLLLAIDAARSHVALATFSHDRHPPRVRALLCERDNILESDADTVCALASARGQIDVLMHARWTEILGREALTRRFYAGLEQQVHALALSVSHSAASDDAHELALLYVSRLLFLSFLETQGWLDGDHGFLANGFADCMASGGRYHDRVLLPLFFGTLNTPPRSRSSRARAFGAIPFLNGGLFSRGSLERTLRSLRFPDETLGSLYGDLLCRHRFTPREESTEWSEAAIDPEMLGKSFESLMAARDRKSSGAFYTPQPLVERVVRDALAHALHGPDVTASHVESVIERTRPGAEAHPAVLARVRALRVLDPACGSGAFLVYALAELSRIAAACGDTRARGEITRSVLVNSIFGVDVNPMAVWLCELRLWLSMVLEQRHEGVSAVTPLPNLDRQIRVGDTLTGGAFGAKPPGARSSLSTLRGRYTRSQGARKRALGKMLDRAERAAAVDAVTAQIASKTHARREIVLQARARDLFGKRAPVSGDTRRALAEVRAALRELRRTRARIRAGGALPFSFDAHFPEVADSGGFDLVVGNPPWVRLHRMPPALRARLRSEFQAFRGSVWETRCQAASSGSGFGSQVDMAALFTERTLDLLRRDGVAALLLPAKLWSSLAGGGIRALIAERSRILALEDLSNAPVAFDAAVYPSVLLTRKSAATPDAPAAFAVHRGRTRLAWTMRSGRLPLDDTSGSPWIIAPAEVRLAFDTLRACGVALSATRLGRPLLGVKSGCNEAFVVRLADELRGSSASILSGDRAGEVESAMLRPAVKGENIKAWKCSTATTRIIWTHGENGGPVKTLPPETQRWLAYYRDRLDARTDGRASSRWWSLFRTDGAASDRPRVVWADVGKRPRAAVLAAGDLSVPLNSCYVLKCRDQREALTLAAILNSDVAAAWLNVLAEPARGGYHRYLGWTIGLLPLPRDWSEACSTLPDVAERARREEIGSRDLLDAVLRAYGVAFADVAPLLAWTG